VVIETTLLARVLRIKLLTLEGTVVVSPARVNGIPDAERVNGIAETARDRSALDAAPGAASARQVNGAPRMSRQRELAAPSEAVGGRLSATASRLEQSRKVLAELDGA